ncbi:SH3 domain-containing protein [candidate division FCPU426 bacterium]|nr:SH3 domain-containing protein [candidate division FCPU426 bacterium]
MKTHKMLLIFLIGAFPWLTGAYPPKTINGPEHMPQVEPEMKQANYWIRKLAEPDRILLSPAEIQALREHWLEQGLILDPDGIPERISRSILREWLRSDFAYLRRVARYHADGRPLTAQDYAVIEQNVNLKSVQGSNLIGWGLAVRRTPLRLFPTTEIATAKPLDIEFDALQSSSLRLAEPVAILHRSLDEKWLYVAAGIERGWVAAADVGRMENRLAWQHYSARATRVVMGREIRFQTTAKKLLADTALMGCQLAPAEGEKQLLDLPRRDAQGRIFFLAVRPLPPEAVSCETKPCTPRVLIEQAFKWLDSPYGWGGGGGYGDCSELIRRLGLTCGVPFPRSTTGLRQALTAQMLPSSAGDKDKLLSSLPGGATLLYLPGHIMLLLGVEKNRTYVIHNLYGIHARTQEGDVIQRVARVVVSDLSLGAGSKKGSLWQRLEAALKLDPLLDK